MNWANLNESVVFEQSGGKIIWQPRIGCWYTDKQFAGEPLPAPYTGMSLPDIYRKLNCSARLYEFNDCFRRIEDPRVIFSRRDLGNGITEHLIETPAGNQIYRTQAGTSSPFPRNLKREVASEEELKVAVWREAHADWSWDQETYDQLMVELGDLGAPAIFLPRMSIQNLYLDKMGTEAGIYALFDWPKTVEAYFQVLEECHERLLDLVNASPIRIVNFGENVHSGTLPPDFFLKYHLPVCQRRCDKLHQEGKFVYAHWDGDCKPLLPYARETDLDGIEAITPKPQGDVTLEEIKAGLGDELFLLDGIPAVYFDITYPVEALEACVQQLIDLFAPKLVLGISDELSSTGDIERVRRVGEMVNHYNQKVAG